MTLSHDGTVELTLVHATARDAGLYCCTATNDVGRVESVTKVNVLMSNNDITSSSQSTIGANEFPNIP